MLDAYTLLVLAWMRTPPDPRIVDLFRPMTLRSADATISYRLFRPRVEPFDRRPLLVWLHGRGEAGDDNRSQLAWLELLFGTDANAGSRFPAHVVALQCPAEVPDWFSRGPGSRDPLADMQQVLGDVCHRYPIDQRRVYLMGISCGASACWELASRMPERFAAMVAFGTTRFVNCHPQRIIGIPIWAFQSTGDGPDSCARTQQMIREIRRLGGRAHLTLVEHPDHDCWTDGLTRIRAWDWVLSQRKGEPRAPAPGCRHRSRPRFSLLGLAFACLLLIAARQWHRRRSVKNST